MARLSVVKILEQRCKIMRLTHLLRALFKAGSTHLGNMGKGQVDRPSHTVTYTVLCMLWDT